MGNILILYDSATGNTTALAHLVAEGAQQVSGTEVSVRTIDEASGEDVLWSDVIAV